MEPIDIMVPTDIMVHTGIMVWAFTVVGVTNNYAGNIGEAVQKLGHYHAYHGNTKHLLLYDHNLNYEKKSL
jgi:hypothetical protein